MWCGGVGERLLVGGCSVEGCWVGGVMVLGRMGLHACVSMVGGTLGEVGMRACES